MLAAALVLSAQKTIDANQAAINALKEEQAKVNDTISGLKDRKADTASYIKALDQSMAELTTEVNELMRPSRRSSWTSSSRRGSSPRRRRPSRTSMPA